MENPELCSSTGREKQVKQTQISILKLKSIEELMKCDTKEEVKAWRVQLESLLIPALIHMISFYGRTWSERKIFLSRFNMKQELFRLCFKSNADKLRKLKLVLSAINQFEDKGLMYFREVRVAILLNSGGSTVEQILGEGYSLSPREDLFIVSSKNRELPLELFPRYMHLQLRCINVNTQVLTNLTNDLEDIINQLTNPIQFESLLPEVRKVIVKDLADKLSTILFERLTYLMLKYKFTKTSEVKEILQGLPVEQHRELLEFAILEKQLENLGSLGRYTIYSCQPLKDLIFSYQSHIKKKHENVDNNQETQVATYIKEEAKSTDFMKDKSRQEAAYEQELARKIMQQILAAEKLINEASLLYNLAEKECTDLSDNHPVKVALGANIMVSNTKPKSMLALLLKRNRSKEIVLKKRAGRSQHRQFDHLMKAEVLSLEPKQNSIKKSVVASSVILQF